jgi:pimeloyl-ACP methyl ester carboxylesterase
MATFVLVHGAIVGSWCWRWVTPYLRAAGPDVYTPSLTGLGERAHLASPDVGLVTLITDVVGTFHFEDLSDVILVGWSYGGMVVA